MQLPAVRSFFPIIMSQCRSYNSVLLPARGLTRISMAAVRAALLEVAFAHMVEIGLGGDMTAACETKE